MLAPFPEDTIAALATAAGGGVGIIRLSGPDAIAVVTRAFDGLPVNAQPRRLYHGWWCSSDGQRLDEGLCVIFVGPSSFTGEDVAEVHLHGGGLSLRRCLEVCWAAGARPAEPGEFSRRAFSNGRLDLTRAEAIADLVAAQTDRELARARVHLRGALYDRVMAAREAVLQLRARLEVCIDFVEEDVPVIALTGPDGLAGNAASLGRELKELAGTYRSGRLFHDGARVVLAGAPNAGKSSLFNVLCGSDRAIVTPHAGTTRDVLEATVDLLGVPVTLVDTAGLRETDDVVETAGVDRARQQVEAADLVVQVIDGTEPPASNGFDQRSDGLVVAAKADLAGWRTLPGALAVSVVDGQGVEALVEAIVAGLGAGPEPESGLVIARERQQRALLRAADALLEARSALDGGASPELAAVDVQEAMDALGELVGLTTIEDVLDRLFSTFCIGK